jgi:hypothetical protein
MVAELCFALIDAAIYFATPTVYVIVNFKVWSVFWQRKRWRHPSAATTPEQPTFHHKQL